MSAVAAEQIVPASAGTPTEAPATGRLASLNQLSGLLSRSYVELEHRIGQLQHELAQTDQRRQQESSAREQLAERLDLILGVMPVAVVLLDGHGVVTQANPMAEELLGEPLKGMRWIDIITRSFAPELSDGHEVVLRNGRLVSLATQSLNSEPGQIIVLTDQTETRRLQDKLNHHRKLSDMGRMTASLAHQIRTPLSSAMLYAEHLGNPELPDDKKVRYAQRIRNQLSQLDQYVRDILIFSRGGIVLDQVLPVAMLTQRLQKQLEELCEQHHASCIVELEEGRRLVRCNPDLFTSAFTNLVENALQACRSATTVPCLQLSIRAASDAVLEIVLCDNGPGIPQGLEQKIMEPFYTTKSTGTGLGLAVVNAIVQGHGGNFAIANQPHGGAAATITLPMMPQH